MTYIRREMAEVSRVRITFQACGTKLVVEQRVASPPTRVAASMRRSPDAQIARRRDVGAGPGAAARGLVAPEAPAINPCAGTGFRAALTAPGRPGSLPPRRRHERYAIPARPGLPLAGAAAGPALPDLPPHGDGGRPGRLRRRHRHAGA